MISQAGRIMSVNKAFEKFTGYTLSELRGEEPFPYMIEEYRDLAAESLARLFSGGSPPPLEVGLKTKLGVKYAEAYACLILTRLQKQALIILMDVTERKRLWGRLREIHTGARK